MNNKKYKRNSDKKYNIIYPYIKLSNDWKDNDKEKCSKFFSITIINHDLWFIVTNNKSKNTKETFIYLLTYSND